MPDQGTPHNDPLRTVAHGGQPEWEGTYEHLEHGELTFKAKLPKTKALTAHSIAMDNELAELTAPEGPRPGTMILVAALAGMKTLVELPVIDRREETDEDAPGRTKIVTVYYDPDEEVDTGFLVQVWTDFSVWRQTFLTRVGELGNSSGETSSPGNDSSESSSDTTGSPSTTPA